MLVSGRVLPRPPPKVVQSQPKKFGVFGWRMQVVWAVIYYKYTYKKTFLEPICDLYLLKVNPPKECLNSNQKQGWVIWVLGQKYIYIYEWYISTFPSPAIPLPLVFFSLFLPQRFPPKKSPENSWIVRSLLRNQESDIPSTVPRGWCV